MKHETELNSPDDLAAIRPTTMEVASRAGGYVLMTAAYNEEATIGSVIRSVVAQTLRPKLWIIVSDGSTDKTGEIVQRHAQKHAFIRFLRVARVPGRSFGAKVRALRAGSKLLDGTSFALIGNLDADVSIDSSYFEELVAKFDEHPGLGIAGGFVCEESGGEFHSRRSNRPYSVAHAAQLVRRECYEAIGGYAVLEYGGEDWHAQTSARMRGWQVEAFPQLKIYHHRHTGEADNLVRHKFRQGRMDYSLGSDPLFEVLKCLERIPERPLLTGGLARLTGFFWSWFRGDKRPVSEEFVAFLSQEQRQKLIAALGGLFGRGRMHHPS
jgi:biofilm PGA synthesis N-glycosyltransferase PgaC